MIEYNPPIAGFLKQPISYDGNPEKIILSIFFMLKHFFKKTKVIHSGPRNISAGPEIDVNIVWHDVKNESLLSELKWCWKSKR